MKEIVLKPKEQPPWGLEAENITPDVLAGKSLEEIKDLPLYEGKLMRKMGDFFTITGESGDTPKETRILIDGDVHLTKRIGQEMREGEIVIKGSTGMHLGSRMRGGRIVVEGDVGDFALQEIRGGDIHIKGNAGNYLASATRGNWRGMRKGKITVDGNVGSEMATFMKGGEILVKGDAGHFAGVHMNGGTIIIEGRASGRVGAEMIKGTIITSSVESLLPGFRPVEKVNDPEVDGIMLKGSYQKYSGDHAEERAQGTLFIKA